MTNTNEVTEVTEADETTETENLSSAATHVALTVAAAAAGIYLFKKASRRFRKTEETHEVKIIETTSTEG